MRSKKSRSTHWVVGLAGKLRMSILGRGVMRGMLVFQLGEKIVVGVVRARSGFRAGDDRAIDVDGIAGVGHGTVSPRSSMARQRWAMPSLEPMVTMASVSGSRSTL